MHKCLKKVIGLFLVCTVMLTSMSIAVFAEDGIEEPSKVGRHYTEKIEITKDYRSNEYVYPAGQTSSTAKKRAYVYSEKHYVVYQRRVGNDTYKRKLYDEYHTTWKGQKKNSSGNWVDDPNYPKKSEVSRERSPIVEITGIIY